MTGKDLLLEQVREWESLFAALYKRKPKPIEREQFFLGLLAGIQGICEVLAK